MWPSASATTVSKFWAPRSTWWVGADGLVSAGSTGSVCTMFSPSRKTQATVTLPARPGKRACRRNGCGGDVYWVDRFFDDGAGRWTYRLRNDDPTNDQVRNRHERQRPLQRKR